jgi:hypothetical protein
MTLKHCPYCVVVCAICKTHCRLHDLDKNLDPLTVDFYKKFVEHIKQLSNIESVSKLDERSILQYLTRKPSDLIDTCSRLSREQVDTIHLYHSHGGLPTFNICYTNTKVRSKNGRPFVTKHREGSWERKGIHLDNKNQKFKAKSALNRTLKDALSDRF